MLLTVYVRHGALDMRMLLVVVALACPDGLFWYIWQRKDWKAQETGQSGSCDFHHRPRSQREQGKEFFVAKTCGLVDDTPNQRPSSFCFSPKLRMPHINLPDSNRGWWKESWMRSAVTSFLTTRSVWGMVIGRLRVLEIAVTSSSF